VWINWEGIISGMGSILFALGFVIGVLPAYETAHQHTQQYFDYYLLFTVLIGSIVYFSLGLIGYLCFRSSVDVDILSNFTGNTDRSTLKAIGTVFQCAICFHLAFIIPGNLVVVRLFILSFRNTLWRIIYGEGDEKESAEENRLRSQSQQIQLTRLHLQRLPDEEESDVSFVIVTSIIILSLYFIVIALEATLGDNTNTVSFVVDLTGGAGGSIGCFIIPGLLALAHNRTLKRIPPLSSEIETIEMNEWRLEVWGWILSVGGSIIVILVTIGTILDY
jgi:amino acid permease